jgi:F-type H+-transporting ATPase subunit gamma
MYNAYKNAATYHQMYKIITPFSGEGDDEPLLAYEFEPDTKSEVLADLHEYLLTSQIYHSLMDGAAAEQSSRMQAMENASKNAGEMIDSLTLQYNRARQARITTELIEIISGASALEG